MQEDRSVKASFFTLSPILAECFFQKSNLDLPEAITKNPKPEFLYELYLKIMQEAAKVKQNLLKIRKKVVTKKQQNLVKKGRKLGGIQLTVTSWQ